MNYVLKNLKNFLRKNTSTLVHAGFAFLKITCTSQPRRVAPSLAAEARSAEAASLL